MSIAWLWGEGSTLTCAGWNGQKTMTRACRKEKSVSVLVLLKWLLSLGSPLSLVTLQTKSWDKMGPCTAQGANPQGLGHATVTVDDP